MWKVRSTQLCSQSRRASSTLNARQHPKVKWSNVDALSCPSRLPKRFYTHTQRFCNKHGEEMLAFLRSSGTLDQTFGPFHIQATRYSGSLPPLPDDNDSLTSTKVLHFQRHGQAYHNFIYTFLQELNVKVPNVYDPDPTRNVLVRPELVDSPLTELGRMQSLEQRTKAQTLNPQLLIVSPLHRALQTAQISFGDFQGSIPFIAHEACREELGLLVCNQRRPLSETRREYPNIDFSVMADTADEYDTLWNPTKRECPKAQAQRIYRFFTDFVRKRPEREIAIVGHSAWLFNMCHAVLHCDKNDPQLKAWFATAEIRSMILTFSHESENQVK